jgi:hypothetical protein
MAASHPSSRVGAGGMVGSSSYRVLQREALNNIFDEGDGNEDHED